MFSVLCASAIRIENKVPGWIASVRPTYYGSSTSLENFQLKYGEYVYIDDLNPETYKWVSGVAATLNQGDQVVNACSYTVSETDSAHYSPLEIIEDDSKRFCVGHVGAECSC